MGVKHAIIGTGLGLIIGIVSMEFMLSLMGSQLSPMTYEMIKLSVPLLCLIAGAYIGYEYYPLPRARNL